MWKGWEENVTLQSGQVEENTTDTESHIMGIPLRIS